MTIVSATTSKHISVLLTKDLHTLKRNWSFLIMFIVLPMMMMAAFSYMHSLLVGDVVPEQHNFYHTTWTKNNVVWREFMESHMSNKPPSWHAGIYNVSVLFGCGVSSKRSVGMVSSKEFNQTFFPPIQESLSTKGLKVMSYNTIDDFYHEVKTNVSNEFCFGFEISDVKPGIDEINITYMFPRDASLDTNQPLYDLTTKSPDWRSWNSTFWYGTPQFMLYVTDLLIMLMTGRRTNEIELAFLPMKTEAFNQMEPMVAQNLTLIFPFFVMSIYLLPLYYMVTKLAEEKESRAREGMIMMGLKHETYFMAWFIFLFVTVFSMSVILVLSASLRIFVQSNLLLILAMCVLYGMTMYGFSFIIVAIFPTKKSSATAASLIHLLSYYVGFMYSGMQKTLAIKLLVCLIPNATLTFMIEHLLQCEFQGSGLTMEFASLQVQGLSFNEGLIFLAVDIVVLGFVGYYLDQVLPKEFGVAKPWNFLCRGSAESRAIARGKIHIADEIQDQERVNKGNFEEVSSQVQRDSFTLKVRGLRKVFGNGKVAVNQASMTMYSGQIFALLGHNGAGKTTTISTLTGLLQPTQGQAVLDGVDIFEDQAHLRENLGVCPQHNVLFDYLTVREHLELYAAFKGVEEHGLKKKVDKMLYEIELIENQNQLANTLSGGQRRKLSVAIALIGDAKVIMLDEPTSGMDTTTRRRFWEMVKQYKEGRIIILTTHYMDEADILGDRICIMAEGSVQCCGSSLFLKNRFGVGYNLVLAKQQGAGCKSENIDKYMRKNLPEATKLQEVSTEITYQLPIGVSPKFKDFFSALDNDLVSLGLGSYGVGITTLEEVFLSIGHGEAHSTTVDKIKSQTADLSKLTPREKLLTEYSIATDHRRNFLTHFLALVKKKMLVMLRDPQVFVMDFFFPMILIYVGLYVSTVELINQDFPKRALSAYDFPHGSPLIYAQHNFNQTEDEVQTFIERSFSSDVGEGKLFSTLKAVDTNISSGFFEQAKELDNVIFDERLKSGPSYGGQFLIQQVSPEDRYYAIAMFLNTSSAAAPMSYCSYALQSVMRDMTKNPNLRLNFHEKPLPFSFKLQTYINAGQGVVAVMGFAVAYMMVADQMVQSIIKERQTNVKHQIMVSGASKLAYWASNFFVDFLHHQLIAQIARLGIHYMEVDAPDVEHVFFIFSLTNPIFVYLISFIFDTDSKASVFVRIFYFALGGVAPIAIQILQVVNPKTQEIGQMLSEYFYPWPIYNLNQAYMSIKHRHMISLLQKLPEHEVLQPLDWEIGGKPIQDLTNCLYACLFCVFLIELGFYKFLIKPIYEPLTLYAGYYYKALRPMKRKKLYRIKKDCHKIDIEASDDEDDRRNTLAARKFLKIVDTDPAKEEKRVIKQLAQKKKEGGASAALSVSQLTKRFVLEERAVDNLSFSLEYGECFALLGVTGAGKSTTFKCLTGEQTPDSGKLLMGGHDVRTPGGFDAARCMIGYCPQFDAIFENLTVQQHLEFYAAIKGVRSDYKAELIEKQIKEMDLTDFVHINAGTLSGGNKRKLQCAIALIGNPPIVLLDEPSTGVDPQAKRYMWTIISNISTLRKQSTVVLTTHSMEEAEALCTKMGIMVDGQFKCFGSSQHIKNKYGMGFEIEVKIRPYNEKEVAQQKLNSEVSSEAVSKAGLEALMKKLGYSDMTREICEGGLGEDLNRVLTKSGKLYVDELMKWAHIERNGLQIINELERVFSEFQLVEHYSNSFTFKVSRDQYSIGAVFGMLEDFKNRFSIQEYSACQTSLEQIFNVFALQAGQKHMDDVSHSKKTD